MIDPRNMIHKPTMGQLPNIIHIGALPKKVRSAPTQGFLLVVARGRRKEKSKKRYCK